MNHKTISYGSTGTEIIKEISDSMYNTNSAINFYCELNIDGEDIVSHNLQSDLISDKELSDIEMFIDVKLMNIAFRLNIDNRPKTHRHSTYYPYDRVEGVDENQLNNKRRPAASPRYPQIKYANEQFISKGIKIYIVDTTKSSDIYFIDNASNTCMKKITSTNNLNPYQLLIMAMMPDEDIKETIINGSVFDTREILNGPEDIKNKTEDELFDMFMEVFGQTYVYHYLPRDKHKSDMFICIENSFGLLGTEEVFCHKPSTDQYCRFYCDGLVNIPDTVSVMVDKISKVEINEDNDEIVEETEKDDVDCEFPCPDKEHSEFSKQNNFQFDFIATEVGPICVGDTNKKEKCKGECHDCNNCRNKKAVKVRPVRKRK